MKRLSILPALLAARALCAPASAGAAREGLYAVSRAPERGSKGIDTELGMCLY